MYGNGENRSVSMGGLDDEDQVMEEVSKKLTTGVSNSNLKKSPSKRGTDSGDCSSTYLDSLPEVDKVASRASDPAWDEERRHYQKITATFKQYGANSLRKLEHSIRYVETLPRTHQLLLKDYKNHLRTIRERIADNQRLFLLMIHEESRLFENQEEVYPSKNMKRNPPEPTNYDFEKMQAVLKQIVRDWSSDGQKERDTCYKPVINAVEEVYGSTKDSKGLSPVKILVPGAGLGRLTHELVRKGYAVEGNEFSLFMLFASNFLLNKCNGKNLYSCYPWIHQTTNVFHHLDQVRPVTFPDIDPCDLPPNSQFSMTAGDFLEVYGTPSHSGAWDCIVTCFFIDCASNIVAFIENIHHCLKDGGTWVNLGPLLYHYAGMDQEHSIEPSFDFLLSIIQKIGFTIERQDTHLPTIYAENIKSMLSYTYNSVFLVCTKKAAGAGAGIHLADQNSTNGNTNDSVISQSSGDTVG